MFVKPHPEVAVTLGHAPGEDGKPAPITTPIVVIDPAVGAPLPKDGREVPDTAYWQRRLRDGDVVLADPPAPVSEVATERGIDPPAPALPAPEHPEEQPA